MTNRDVAFDGLLAKLTTLSSRRGLASRDVRNLADGFCRLDGPLTKILLAREDVKIDPTDMTLINDELAALRETTHCAVKELEAGCSQAETKTWVVFLKVSFIKALLCAEKLYVLVDSVLKYRRPGWESSEIQNIRYKGYKEAEAKCRDAVKSVESGSANFELTPPPTPTLAQMVPQVVSEEEGTGDSEESELSECQQKLQKFTEALKSAHRAIDKPKLKRVEELEENDPQGAEMICRELIGLEEDRAGMGPGVTDDTTILHRKYKLAELLLSQKKYPEAEVTARDVYEKRKRHSGEASKTTRLSLLLICRALRGPKPIESYTEKYREAETTHWNIWHLPKDESNKCWRVQNGYELAMVVAEQNHCKEAVIVYNEVREAEKAIADLRPDERSAMLDSRHKLGEILCREKHFEDAVSVLKPVWDEKESMATAEVLATSLGWLALGKETVSMATAEALAISLGSLALWKEGGNIRRWICNEVRRKKLPEDHPKVIECRLNYGKVLLKTEEFTEAAYQLGKALGHRDQEHFDADDCETLEIRHYYCKALVGKGDYAAAEGWTRKVWERRWQILPDLDRNKLTMESCHLYGFVMLKLKNFLGAENILGQVSNLRKMVIGPDHFDTLESSLEYGNSLLEQNSAEKWSRARNVFSEAWNFRDCDSIRAQPVIAYDTILKIGCSLAYTLRKLGEYDVARILMEDVFEKKRRHLYPKVLSDGDPFRIALADMRQPRPPPATQPPPPPPPPPTPPPPPPPPTPKHREGKQRRVYVLPYINGRPADPSGKHRKPKKPRKPEGTRKTDGSIRTEATRGSVGTRGSGGTRKPEGMNRPGYPLKVKMKFGLSAL